MNFDVVVAGGSVAGLLCAREIASGGFSVLVIEEDYEIGTPEHCGGLVSMTGLEELGVIPFRKTFDHMIESAEIKAPNGITPSSSNPAMLTNPPQCSGVPIS